MKSIISIFAALALLSTAQAVTYAHGKKSESSQGNSTAINYMALENPYYTYDDLMLAKTRDYSDKTIAKLVKIAEKSHTRFADLSDALFNGDTFYMICNHYGVSLAALDHVRKQEDQVANYISAYQTTGKYAFPNGGFPASR